MKKLIIIFFFILSIISCSKKIDVEMKDPEIRDSSFTFLALGDSYTIGESVQPAERFPNQTMELLRRDSLSVAAPKIIAATGWTTSNLITTLNNSDVRTDYDIVTLLIGVNNQYQHQPIDQYKSEFAGLLQRAILYAGNKNKHVFVLSIPDYSVTPFASQSDTARITEEIDAFNSANKKITEAAGVNYLDITPISREAKRDPSLIATDGLHPSAAQYSEWSILLAPMIKEIIK
jgi:lysophospholipase L1-like esterase